ncbi:MAG TPA: polysaccharide deacetylase family protein [Chitinophagaceae bacterium]|nr:polysaccharide deacetylase family protein [Chitinophagaceae bacterium]
MFYFVKTPGWLKRIYDSYIWSIPVNDKILYLTFDDGPHPEATPFVLKELKKHNALATFFCIGKNVVSYPGIYKQIINEGHSVGNHTYNHLNGWKTSNDDYLKDIALASHEIDSDLFRPPYGRITSFQAKNLKPVMKGKEPKVIMWDVLSGDFDPDCTAQQCLSNVLFASVPGSIVVFHDSEKAFPKLEYTLPRMLSHFSEKGYLFKAL